MFKISAELDSSEKYIFRVTAFSLEISTQGREKKDLSFIESTPEGKHFEFRFDSTNFHFKIAKNIIHMKHNKIPVFSI